MKKSATMLGVLCALIMILSFVGCKQPTDNGNGGDTPPATTYTVGDTGPGGGKIFFVNTDGAFGDWTYLEAAPADLVGTFAWGAVDKDVTGTKHGIGTGKKNTEVIITALAALTPPETSKAAQAAKAYRGGDKDDWFLPSKDELNEMYKQKEMIGCSDFDYWSSSQTNARSAWFHEFRDNRPYYKSKDDSLYVRVIRSF